MSNVTDVTFEGTAEQQSLAAEVFRLMAMQGSFFAEHTLIRQSLTNLAEFLAPQHNTDTETMAQQLDAALSLNSQVFQRDQTNGEIVYMTTRLGKPHATPFINTHTFRERLYQPDNPLPIDDISVVVSTSRPTLTAVEPVYISEYWQERAGLLPEGATSDDEAAENVEVVEAVEAVETASKLDTGAESSEPPAIETDSPFAILNTLDTMSSASIIPPAEAALPPEIEVPETEGAIIADDDSTDNLLTPSQPVLPSEPVPDPEEAIAAVELPTPEPLPTHTPKILTLDDQAVDLALPLETVLNEHGDLLRARLLDYLDQDPLRRIVRFGDLLYPEAALINLGKNDMRRIRDNILEADEPLLDTTIIAELYHQWQQSNQEEVFRFSLNYRLSREKDFEYVGVPGANLWSTRGLSNIGTKRVKASEMAQFTSYLVEGYDESTELQSPQEVQETGSVTHFLSFFEWAHGLIVYDATIEALLPLPKLPDQRSAVLRFELPQHFNRYILAEVRYPTNNRGGWLQGFEEFFSEYLVAGASIVIERTEEPHIFTMVYEEMPTGTSERILMLDEKKNRFTFETLTFYCAYDEHLLLDQKRFGRLKNLKSLSMSDRRKSDVVLEHAFSVMGQQIGTRNEPEYQLDLDMLYGAYNVLRPASRKMLVAQIEAHPDMELDPELPDRFTYRPEIEMAEEDDDEDDEDVLTWDYGDDTE